MCERLVRLFPRAIGRPRLTVGRAITYVTLLHNFVASCVADFLEAVFGGRRRSVDGDDPLEFLDPVLHNPDSGRWSRARGFVPYGGQHQEPAVSGHVVSSELHEVLYEWPLEQGSWWVEAEIATSLMPTAIILVPST
jgi:hypothetical protein